MASALWLFGQVDTLHAVAPIPIEAVTVKRVRNSKKLGPGRLISEAESHSEQHIYVGFDARDCRGPSRWFTQTRKTRNL
jgi:hypothetical protein